MVNMRKTLSKVRSYYETHERSCRVHIDRPVFDQLHFDDAYGVNPPIEIGDALKARVRAKLTCTRRRAGKLFRNLFPIVKWLPTYAWKDNFVKDLIGGITIGIVNISQGMAYGMLAGLPPVYGLYTSLFPALFYAIFATSHHNSVGVFAITSIMTQSAIVKPKFEAMFNITSPTDRGLSHNCSHFFDNDTTQCENPASHIADARVQIATSLMLLVGLLMILFGLLRLGFLSSYMSDQLVQGLTTGAAFHVFTSQVGHLLGITQLPPTDSNFGLILYYVALFGRIQETNIVTVLLSLMFILILEIYKEFLADCFKRRLHFPFPIELFVVIIGTTISYTVGMHNHFHVRIVESIPIGIPAPRVPRFDLMQYLVTDAVSIAIVTFAIAVSLAKIFAKENNYKIDPNQEWLAFGFAQTISSCFSCFCGCASLSRSGLGGKTQIANLISCLILLVVLVGIASIFEPLPVCVLSAIVVVNLKGLLMQLKALPPLWQYSKLDFAIFVVTFLAVIVVNVTMGLAVGVLFSVLSVVFRSQWPDVFLLGQVGDTNIYKGLYAYSQCRDVPGVKIFRFDAPLYFANADFFKSKICKTVGIDPYKCGKKNEKLTLVAQLSRLFSKAQLENRKRSISQTTLTNMPTTLSRVSFHIDTSNDGSTSEATEIGSIAPANAPADATKGTHHIIIDCSTLPYIDVMGVDALRQVHDEYKAVGITVYLSGCKVEVRRSLDTCKFYDAVPKCNVFLDIHDAVLSACSTAEKMRVEEYIEADTADFACQFAGPDDESAEGATTNESALADLDPVG